MNVPRRLVVLAALLSGVCCVIAFAMLVLRDQGHPSVMIHDQSAPSLSAQSKPALHAPAALPVASGPAASPMHALTSPEKKMFSLSRQSRSAMLASARIKLIRADAARKTYDISVIMGHRSSFHRQLKVNQPFWISLARGSGAIEIVVDAIQDGGIAGYWTESARSAKLSSRVPASRR